MRKVTYVIYINGEEHYEEKLQKDCDEIFDKLVRLDHKCTVTMVRREVITTQRPIRIEVLTGHNYETGTRPLGSPA
jgi:hypothetical protein